MQIVPQIEIAKGEQFVIINAKDKIKDTINYSDIAQRIEQFAKASNYQLIESFGDALASIIFNEFKFKKITVSIQKPSAIPKAELVCITIHKP